MYQNPEHLSGYASTPDEADYMHPDYYQQEEPQESRAAQPVQALEAYPEYREYAEVPSSGEQAAAMEVYQEPESIEGYTTDAGAEQRETAGTGKRKGKLAGLGGLAVTIGALLLKFKTALLLLLDLKWVALIAKFGFTGFSILASVVVYSLLFPWYFAVGLVALLFVHEMGHAIMMKLKGIPIGGMIFIPMLGAAVLMRQMPHNARDEAEVGIAGPIAGSIGALVCLVIAELSPRTPGMWASLAYLGFFLNLINLVPIVPFDGGRVLAAIDRRVWIVGFVALLAFQIWSWMRGNSSVWLLFFILMAAIQLWSRRSANTPQEKEYYRVPMMTRIVLSLLYFGLAALLVLGMSVSHALVPGIHY